MAEQMIATVRLETGMGFDAEAGSGHHVTLDAAEHSGGQNTGFRPMELLLVGLGGCTGMDVISILRKKRQQVTGYAVHVSGLRAEENPMVFVEITFAHIITGYHIQSEAVARAIQLSEERYCGAGAMLGKVAHLTHTFRIVEVAETRPVVTATSS
ncbi:MAG TPA: OsmC family protein [Ktedonobacteraceae bacterium]